MNRYLAALLVVVGVVGLLGVLALEGVMNFSPYTIASGHGYSKTIPQ
jgi:hypothetical protein